MRHVLRSGYFKNQWLYLALGVAAAGSAFAQTKIAATPSLLQEGYGGGGYDLIGDGSSFCGATAATSSLGYLANIGFTQILSGTTQADYLQLERNIIGLSGSTQAGGVMSTTLNLGVKTYLEMKGFSNFSLDTQNAPTVEWFANTMSNVYEAAFLVIGWYSETSPGVFERNGGHFIGVTGAEIDANGPAPGYLVLNNPMPSSLFNVPDVPNANPQYAHTIHFTGTISGVSPMPSYIQFDPNQINSYLSGSSRAIIEGGFTIRISDTELPSGSWTPSTWTLTSDTPDIDTGGADLEVLAPVAGTHGIHKKGGGMLSLTGGSNVSTGTNTIMNGGISSNQTSGTPLGTGTIVMYSGTLALEPAVDGSPTDVSLTLAGGSDQFFAVEGGAKLVLDPSGNTSLTVLIGDSTSAVTENFRMHSHATLAIAATTGNTSLGNTVRVLVAGSGSIPVHNGMVSSAIVAQNSNPAADGDFLIYDTTNGFSVATYASSGTLALADATSDKVYNTVSNQTLAEDATATVHAIRVQDSTISSDGGTTTLVVGSGSAQTNSGVILNNGRISTSVLDFGDAQGTIYTSNGGGIIDSVIQSSAGVLTFGPGNTVFTAASTYTGGTQVHSGTLTLRNTEGSATGTGDVEVVPGATLVVSGSLAQVAGNVHLDNSTLLLEGGSVGGLTTTPLSNVGGNGRITGEASINGTVGAFGTIGTLVFEAATTFEANSVYEWTLGSLVDSTTGTAGVDWNILSFETTAAVSLGTDENSPFTIGTNFSLVDDPNGVNAFWDAEHKWLIIQSELSLSADGNSMYVYWGLPQFEQGNFYWESTNGDTEIWLHYAPIPEPGTWALAAIGLSLLFVFARQSRSTIRLSSGNGSISGVEKNH